MTNRVRSRLQSLGGELPMLAVLAVAVLGFVAVRLHYWRRGTILIGGAILLAAALRLVLPARRAGLLVVRSRPLDVAVLALLGLAIIVLAVLLPIV